MRMNESDEIKNKYRRLCNEIKAPSRKDKQDWLDKKRGEIENQVSEHQTREGYKLTKNVNRKWQPKQLAIKDSSGNILMEKEGKQCRWTELWRSIQE